MDYIDKTITSLPAVNVTYKITTLMCLQCLHLQYGPPPNFCANFFKVTYHG